MNTTDFDTTSLRQRFIRAGNEVRKTQDHRYRWGNAFDRAHLAIGHLEAGNLGEAERCAGECLVNGGARFLLGFAGEVYEMIERMESNGIRV